MQLNWSLLEERLKSIEKDRLDDFILTLEQNLGQFFITGGLPIAIRVLELAKTCKSS